MMKFRPKKLDSEAVAKSLKELEMLFGRKAPTKENPQLAAGEMKHTVSQKDLTQ